MTWKQYEQYILDYFKSKYPSANIEHDVKKIGSRSKVQRQIDILITQYVCGYCIEIAIECKNWQSPLDVADVEQFIAKLNDIKVTKGVMVALNGYTKAAKDIALDSGNIQLHVLKPEELNAFTGFWGNPYRGNSGAILFPPNGWILDSNIPDELIGNSLCLMYPMEYTLIESIQKKECIFFYIPFISAIKEDEATISNQLAIVLKRQEIGIIEYDTTASYKYWNTSSKHGTVTNRLTEYKDYSEIAVFITTSNAIFNIWGICSKPHINNFIEYIQFMVNELIIITLDNVDINNSHDAWNEFLLNYTSSKVIMTSIFK